MKKENLSCQKIENIQENLKKNVILKNKKSCFINVILFQMLICCFIVVGFLTLKLVNYNAYLKLNEKIKTSMQGLNFKDFVKTTFFNLKDFFNESLKVEKFKDDEEKKDENLNYEKDYEEKKENKEKFIQIAFEDDFEKSGVLDDEKDDDVTFFNFKRPLNGRIASKYGSRENPILKNKQDFHYGVDIAVKDDTPIVAIADGVVVRTANSKKSGNFLFIKHGDMYESLYAHCNKILVEKGRFVKKGEKIALSGHTGDVTGAHLHLGIKKNGNWINPAEVFPEYV